MARISDPAFPPNPGDTDSGHAAHGLTMDTRITIASQRQLRISNFDIDVSLPATKNAIKFISAAFKRMTGMTWR